MRRAIWSAAALLLAGLSFGAGRFGLFHPLPEIAAALPGDESQFQSRIRRAYSRALPDRVERRQADRLPHERGLSSRLAPSR